MKKQLILYLLSKDDVGGAEKYVRDLAVNIDAAHYETRILRGGRDVRWLSNAFRPYILFINDCCAIFELKKLFRKQRPDIVHLNNSKAGVLGAIAAKMANKDIRVVFTAHGWVFQPGSPISSFRRWFYTMLHRWAARFQDAIIAVSDFDRDLALEKRITAPMKITTIHNGIDPSVLTFLSRDEARKKLIPSQNAVRFDTLWVGSIGRLVKEKDYSTLVKAAALTEENAHFFIIGKGPEENVLQKLIEQHNLKDRFLLLGERDNAHQYLKAFDVFALASVKEGLPYTILEAISAGVPVVASSVGGVPEIIREKDLLVPPKSPEDLSKAISNLLNNPERRKEIARQNERFLKNQFSLSNMISKTEAMYRSLERHDGHSRSA